MIQYLKALFKKWKSGTEYLNYGREIVLQWSVEFIVNQYRNKNQKTFLILDHGCGRGDDLINIDKKIKELNLDVKLELYGIENYPPYVKECQSKGIHVISLDIERDIYPFDEHSVDIIITNQVLEHTKEIFWIFEQFTRILKPEGILIIGVPNLASLHNRILLLFGHQPTAQQSLGAHVRSFTLPDLRSFVEVNQFFEFVERKGSNFYPFPPSISKPLAKLFPSLAWGLFAKFKRTHKEGSFFNLFRRKFFGDPVLWFTTKSSKRICTK
ncbi:MAG: class I SAM-dependent methyltransferase [Candidatus Omnitrophica bacterium]|nr:class I SAM-dependent methyltransferase [Candidatus Omnitrophota bacterium]